jgi:zinc protease
VLAQFLAPVALATILAADAAPAPSASPAPSAASVDPLPHAPVVDTLDNGLTVVTVPFDAPGIVSFFTLVKAGSRDEVEPGKSGYAHLFEHLMFRGTDKMSAHEYEQKMQAMGADNNAFTSNDLTVYTPTLPKQGLADLIQIEADRFQHLHVAEDKYKDETGAVLGEYNKNFSNPARVIDEALRGLAFKAHTYGHTTLGTKRDVEDMPRQYAYSLEFFRRFYTPDDCVIFAVGDVDRAKVVEMVKAAYGGWKGKRAITAARPEPEQTAPRTRALTWKGPTEPRLREGYRIPATPASLRDAAALATVAALAFSDSSELYQRLVVNEQKLITLDVDPDDILSRDPGLFSIDAKLRPTTSFDEIIKAIDDTLAKVARGETPPARLEAVRSHLLSALTLGLETTGAVATQLAYFTAITGDVGGFQAYARELSKVTAEDVARVAKLLVPAHRNVITMVSAQPEAKLPVKALPATPQVPPNRPPPPPPAPIKPKAGAK